MSQIGYKLRERVELAVNSEKESNWLSNFSTYLKNKAPFRVLHPFGGPPPRPFHKLVKVVQL